MSGASARNSFSSPQSGTGLPPLSFRHPLPRMQSTSLPGTVVPPPSFCPPSTRSQSSSISASSEPPQSTHWHGLVNAAGDRHGRGVLMWAENRCEGECVNGVEQGNWVFENLHGALLEGRFLDGKKNGRWTERFSNGNLAEGDFAEGKRTGPWSLIKADGTKWLTTFQDDKMDHDWQVRATGVRGKRQSLGPLAPCKTRVGRFSLYFPFLTCHSVNFAWFTT